MYIIAAFENSIFIELAISELEVNRIPKERILAAPLNKKTNTKRLFDTIQEADGVSLFDGPAILGTCLMLLGAIYGYVLKWGPIIWGLIGAICGLLLGFIIKLLVVKKNKSGLKKITSEIVLMIRCEEPQCEMIEQILWKNSALGISKIRNNKG